MIDTNLGPRRGEIAGRQQPFAVVVSCSDSRVPPEIVFDQTLGNIFVVRSAGHALGPLALGSIEYAVEHLGPQLVVVLGHTRCGAVEAALKGGHHHGHVANIVAAMKPAVAASKDMSGNPVTNAVRANVEICVTGLTSQKGPFAKHLREGHLKIVGAVYDLDTGLVSVIPTLKTGL